MPHKAPKIEVVRRDSTIPLPTFATDGAAAMDLRVDRKILVHPKEQVVITTGIAIHIKDHHIVGVVVPRSSVGVRLKIQLANTVGIIDSDYQGEIKLVVVNNGACTVVFEPHNRVAQILFMPILRPVFDMVDEFSETTQRGGGGFGSTGSD